MNSDFAAADAFIEPPKLFDTWRVPGLNKSINARQKKEPIVRKKSANPLKNGHAFTGFLRGAPLGGRRG
jgi:hypothetical protein